VVIAIHNNPRDRLKARIVFSMVRRPNRAWVGKEIITPMGNAKVKIS
jgi:hypothetical protein